MAEETFKPKARIILQLGDQLIRSESIALLELVKNSYDACATKVIVRMKNIDNSKLGEISIEDDGDGMDYTIIKDVWLQPGTSYKKKQINDNKIISSCGRIPLGEKGIGRFGAHKLGGEIELVSKKLGAKEVYVKIKWSDFDNDDFLEKMQVDLKERRTSEVFGKNEHGTKIFIRSLRNTWTRGTVRELHRAINSLNSPFDSLSGFKVLFKIDKQEWLSGLLKFSDVKPSALFSADVTINGNKIKKLKYEFTPWATMKKLKTREFVDSDIDMVQKVYDDNQKKKIQKDIDLSLYKIGEIRLKMLIFDFDTKILSFGVQDKKGLKDYLKTNGGIRVYKDGVRVYDYGEPGNDWLNLDIERVNLPSARISNNIVIGAVLLDRLKSIDLEEKTNREGFIENNAYREFLSAIRFTIARVVTQRNIDKDKLRTLYGGTGIEKKVPVVDNLQILKDKIGSSITDTSLKSDLLKTIKEIETDYKTINEIYLRSASAGLSLSIVIHEIEKIIAELMKVVDDSMSADRIKLLTRHLGKLIDGYGGLIKRKARKRSDLVNVLKDSLWNIEYRLHAHGIQVASEFLKKKKFDTTIKCSESLLMGTIINIIDNSIWWLNYGKVQNKKLFIDISNEFPEYITIVIADNGPGFTLPTEEIIKPFISNKEGGMGIGLHLAQEIMNSHGGELLFPTADDFTIPKDFRSGAIVALAFTESKTE